MNNMNDTLLEQQAYALNEMKHTDKDNLKDKYVFARLLEYFINEQTYEKSPNLIDSKIIQSQRKIVGSILARADIQEFMKKNQIRFLDISYLAQLYFYGVINSLGEPIHSLEDLLNKYLKNSKKSIAYQISDLKLSKDALLKSKALLNQENNQIGFR